MGRSALALANRENDAFEIIWGCLQERKDYLKDCLKEYKKGRTRTPSIMDAFTPDGRLFEKYGISYPIHPKTPFSGQFKNLITIFMRSPKVRDLTLLKNRDGLGKLPIGQFSSMYKHILRKTECITLEIGIKANKETLLKEVAHIIERYQNELKKLKIYQPGTKGAELKAAKKRLMAFKLYKSLRSYPKTAIHLESQGFLYKGYAQKYPENAKRDVIRLIQEAEELIGGGYKKLR